MRFYVALIVLWITMVNDSLELEMTEAQMKTITAKFCGSHLADMLSVVCNGLYNNKQKRNMYKSHFYGRDDYKDVPVMEYPEESFISFPFQSKKLAKSIFSGEFRKRVQGVANECCYKACSLWEMSGYCAKP